MMKQRIVRYLTIAALALASIPVSMAQTSTETPTPQPPTATPAPGNPIDLYGEISAVSGNTIVVNGLTVDISRAEIDVQIAVGTLVDVEGWLVASNEVLAREVDPFDDDDVNGEFELVGEIEAVSGTSILVAGFTFDVSRTELNTALITGAMVRVEATLINGVLQAREVYPFVPGSDEDGMDDNGSDDSNDDNSNDDNGMDESSSVPSGVTPGFSMDAAIAAVLSIYPNTTITEIELTTLGDGTLVWDIDTSHGLDLWIDANTGTILRIDDNRNDDRNRDDDRESSSNSGSSSDDSRDDERSERRDDDRNDDSSDDDRNDDSSDDDRNDDSSDDDRNDDSDDDDDDDDDLDDDDDD